VKLILGASAAYVVLGGLVLSPLLWVSVPPLVDYPNHLARMWVLVHGSENYVANWQLIPTLAMDLVVPALALIMPVETAGRVFIAISMALPVIGCLTLHRALHGRVGPWPLASLLFVYNAVLFWGFLNYLFTLGAALLAFSGWIASSHWRPLPRLAVFAPIACLLFVLHLFGLGIYGLLVGSYELGNWLADRQLSRQRLIADATKFAQFGPVALLWLASLSNGGPRYTEYGNSLAEKVYALSASMAFGTAAGSVAIVCWGLFYVGWRRGMLKLHPSMRLPVLTMIIAAVLMPNWLYGSWLADIRLPVVLPFVLIASTRLDIQHRKTIASLAALALLFLGARVYALTLTWRDADNRFAEFRAASRAIPEGARLLIAQSGMPDKARRIDGMPLTLASLEEVNFHHMPSLAVMDRGAFIPYLFTQFTIRPAPRNAGGFVSVGLPLSPEELVTASPDWGQLHPGMQNMVGERPYWLDWTQRFDFVLWIDFGERSELLPEKLSLVASGSFFKIYRIIPEKASIAH
jgi:hypothetical protein